MKKTNSEILNEIRFKAKNEQRLTLEVIELIKEVDTRKLYLSIGFGSLFEFVTKDLGYEPGSAMRRIQAARMIHQVPEVKEKIQEGNLSLTVVSQVQNFLRKEAATAGKRTSTDRAVEILKLVENKTSREVEKELARLCPEIVKKAESQREISENLTELKIVLDAELMKELNELKLLFSHQNPNLSYVELIRIMSKKVRASLSPAPELKIAAQQNLANIKSSADPKLVRANVQSRTRHIPSSVRRLVWQRDQGHCQYKDPQSGRPCLSQYKVQIDHIQRFCEGGSHEPQNLRLYCTAHNRWRG